MEKKITEATLKRTFKRFYCPECGKALINIADKDELLDGISKFWCDDCKLDFTIEDTKDDYLYGEMKVRIADDFEGDVLHSIPMDNADNQYDNVDLICKDDVLNAPNIFTDKDHPYLHDDNCTLSSIYLDEMIENHGYSITVALDNEYPSNKSIYTYPVNKIFKPLNFDDNDKYFVYYSITSNSVPNDQSIFGVQYGTINCYVIQHSNKTRRVYKYKSHITIALTKNSIFKFINEICDNVSNCHIYPNTSICIPGVIRSIIWSKKSMFAYRKGATKYDIPVGSCEIGPFNFLELKSDPVKDCYFMVTVTEIKNNSNCKYPTYIIYDFHWRNVNHTISYCAANIGENKYNIRKYYGDSNLSEFIGLKHSKHFNAHSEYIPKIIKEDYRISEITLSNRDKNN